MLYSLFSGGHGPLPASYSRKATKAVLDIQVWVTTDTLHEGPYYCRAINWLGSIRITR